MPRTVIISQARMGSTRLPGKVLKTILDKPVLEYHLERVRTVKNIDLYGVATTTQKRDDAIVSYCEKNNIPCYRGSENDVLSRYYEAAKQWQAEVVVRVTSDTPLLEPEVIEYLIQALCDTKNPSDYTANFYHSARTFPVGMEAEVMTMEALTQAHLKSVDPAEREHVTPYIWKRPDIFKIRSFARAESLSHLRWTVDTPQDFDLISRILEDLYPRQRNFRMSDVLSVLARHPDWEQINAGIHHKYLDVPSDLVKQEIVF